MHADLVGHFIRVALVVHDLVLHLFELECRVGLHTRDYFLHLLLVLWRSRAVRLDCELLVLLGVHGQSEQHLHRAGGHSALVGRGVLEEQDAQVLYARTDVLGDEQVGPFHNLLEAGFALTRQQLLVGVVDGLWAPAARDQHVCSHLVLEDKLVPEGLPGDDFLVVGQHPLPVFHEHLEPTVRELPPLLLHALPVVRELVEFLFVESVGVVDDAGDVGNTDEHFVAHEYLVGAEVSIGATGDHLGHLALVQPLLALDALDLGAHRARGHAVLVVGDTPERRRLASGGRLELFVAALLTHLASDVHLVSCVLVRPEEEYLGRTQFVDD